MILILFLMLVIPAALISGLVVRGIIAIARKRKLYDIPDNIRKIHGTQIPSLGGIGIFVVYVIGFELGYNGAGGLYLLAPSVLLFITGIYDDIKNVHALVKLVVQFAAAATVVVMAGVQLKTLTGLTGLISLSPALGACITIFCCAFFINVFNFMDGIDGLACTLAILYALVLAGLFIYIGEVWFGYFEVLFCLAGGAIGLLFYNRPPARIYMGDTGSMLLGFTIFVFAVLCINESLASNWQLESMVPDYAPEIPMLVVSMLFLPVYDALRVSALRVSKGISPLRADRLHLHYYLLDAGLSHGWAVLVIVGTTLVTMGATFLISHAYMWLQWIAMVLITSMPVVWAARRRRQRSAS